MKTNNDILAKYVREKYPNIPRSFDFALYSAAQRIKEFGIALKNVLTPPVNEVDTENTDGQHESD